MKTTIVPRLIVTNYMRGALLAAATIGILHAPESRATVTTFWSAGANCAGSSSAPFDTGGASAQFSLCATTTNGDGVCGATIVPQAPSSSENGHFSITNRVLNATLLPDPTAGAAVTYPVALTNPASAIQPSGTLDWGGTTSNSPPPASASNQVLATFTFTPTVAATDATYVIGLNDASVVTTSSSNCLLAPADTPITAVFTLSRVTDSVQFAQSAYSVLEGSSTATNVGLTRTGSLARAATVVWTTANGAAIAGTDFGTASNVAQRSGTLSWAAGDGSTKNISIGPATALIPIINNSAVQGARNFSIKLSSPTNLSLGSPSSTTLTINDDDSQINFTGSAVTVSEAGPNVTLQVVKTGAIATATTATWTTANGSATVGADFGTLGRATQLTGTINFGIGDAGPKTITIGPASAPAPYIPIINDTSVEGPETFTINLSGATVGPSKSATVTILSTQKGLAMAGPSQSFAESAGSQSIAVNRLGDASGTVSVSYSFANGSAINGTHYSGAPGTLTWLDGDSSPKSIPFTLIDNNSVNSSHTFTVNLANAVGATLASPTSTAITILDDDTTVQFSAAAASTTSNQAAISLTLTRSGVLTNSAAVTYSAVNGTAIAGLDFGTLGNGVAPSGTVNWAPGAGGNQTISIPILHDPNPGPAKTFSVQLSNPSGTKLSIGTPNQVVVTINDSDNGVAFASPTYSVTEGTPTVSISVVRVGSVTGAATATWAAVNGTAVAGQDYGAASNFTPPSGAISWAAGDATSKSFTVSIIDDKLGGEGDETFTINLAPGTGVVLGMPAVTTVTIHDNDPAPQSNVQFAQPKYVVSESVGSAVVTLHRTDAGGGFGQASSVAYTTVPGSALASTDFTTKTGTVSWAAGDSSDKTISITIVNNSTAEPNKSFQVVLLGNTTSPTGFTGFGPNSSTTVLILDDDELFPPPGTFPPDGPYPPGWSQPSTATAGWHASNDPSPFEGAFVLRSDQIWNNESAAIQVAGTFATGFITFELKVSSEAGFDVLSMVVDNIVVGKWSGTTVPGWQKVMIPITAGPHTVAWWYQKDTTMSAGQDAMFMDALSLPGFAP